jgi:hypothetical protein
MSALSVSRPQESLLHTPRRCDHDWRCTNFPKIYEPHQNSQCHKGDMKQVPFWGPTNMRSHRTKCCGQGDWDLCTPGLEAIQKRIISKPLLIQVLFPTPILWLTVEFASQINVNWNISKLDFRPISRATTAGCRENKSARVIMYT